MLTLVGENPSWLVGWESSHVYEQTRRMIRVTCSCKGLRGWKHIVNGHLLTIIRVGSSVTVSDHAAWTWSRGEQVWGLLTGESAAGVGRGGAQRWAPRSLVLTSLLASDVLQNTLGDYNSPAIFQGATDHCCWRSPSTRKDFYCPLHCWRSCLALSSQLLHTSLWRKPHSTVVSVAACPHEAMETSSTYQHCLTEEPDCVSINSFFCQ